MQDAPPSPHRLNELLAKTTRAAYAASTVEGPDVFGRLAEQLAEILAVGATMIATAVAERPGLMLARSTWLDGGLLRPFEYELAQTPCRSVIGRDSRFVASGVHGEFAPGTLFHAKGFDSYAARSLLDGSGRQLGLIVAMDRAPMTDAAVTEAVLQIFAVRASAELERERGQAALRASEASYRAIFEANEDAIFIHDWASGAILDVSPKAAELYGYPREALRRMRVGDISANVPPYTESDAVARIEQAKRGAGPVRFEWQARHRDGRLMWNEVTLKRAEIAGESRVLAFVRDITESRQAEKRLRDSEERYRLLFETESDAIVLVDVATLRLIDANRAAEALWGYGRDALLALTVADLSAEPDQSRDSIQSPTGQVHIPLRMHRRRDGTVFPVEITANRLVLEGRPTVVAAVRDITERKRAEQALLASEEQYRTIFNASVDAMVLWDSDLRRVDINPAYERLFGLTREQVLAGVGFEHLPIEYTNYRRRLVQRTLAGERCHAELESVRRDGTHLSVEVRTIPIQHRGQPHVLAIVRDITERKQAEGALRASEEQYRSIFNASADALVLRDADFRIVDVNATYESMTGLSREEALGADRVLANPPEVNESIRPLHRRALAGDPIVLETQLVRRDGARYELELRGVPIQHRGAPHVLYMGRDITARRRAEDQQRELQAQLRQVQKMEAIGQLTGGIAHDFNNILAAIMGYVGLALERPATAADGKLADYLEQAEVGCRRARDLIQQMLAFSRGRQGERRATPLSALVDESLRLLRATFPSSIALEVESADDGAVAEVDPVQLQQVLLNLGINARDATGSAGRIRFGVRRQAVASDLCASCGQSFSGDFHRLWVTDSGPGIPPQLRDRIFEPFFSTKAPGRGTGMGLATVHRIVHDHGGHLLVESNHGTRFDVLLPADPAASASALAVASPTAPRRALLRGRVLLVDDEESVLGFMRELLQSWGLEVVAVRQALAARDLLAAAEPGLDLLITDQTMPELGGVDLAHAARTLRPNLPVLLYSGHADLIDVAALKQAGIRRVLRKPLEPAELRSAIEECLARS